MIRKIINSICLIGLGFCSQPFFAQPFDCEMVVPPFQIDYLSVTINGDDLYYVNSSEDVSICWNTDYTSQPNWLLFGGSPEQNSALWYPFKNTICFSNPVKEVQFLLLVGGLIYPEIDFGAENFVFETPNCGLTLESIYSCHTLILEDTIYLGVGNTGTGWFSVTFDEPVMEFTISGKGGGTDLYSKSAPTPYR